MSQKLIRKHVKSVRICNYDSESARIIVKETEHLFTIVSPKSYKDCELSGYQKPFTLIARSRDVEFETT